MHQRRTLLGAAMVVIGLSYPMHHDQVHGQVGLAGEITAYNQGDNCNVSFVVGRTFYVGGGTAGIGLPADPVPEPIPGSSKPVATGECNGFYVVLANGDVYRTDYSTWTYAGNFLSAPTPVNRETLGGLKSRYR